MTGLFRFPRFTVFGALFLGLVVLADDSVGAISFQESTLAGLASQDRQHGQVRQLLAKGVNPNVPVNFGKTAVHEAAYAGAAQNLTALLEAGGDPHARDQDGNTPLHLASMGSLIGRYPAAIRALLTRRADLHRTNDAGETPLHVAVFNGVGSAGPAVVKTLLDAGAKPKTVDGNGLTALQRFARHGEDMGGIVTLLIRAGADPNPKDPRGDAPLHAAIKGGGSHGKAEIVEALLAGGADPCVQDAGGSTPYHVSSGMQRIHRALARAGGDDASHAGDSGCKWLFEDAPQEADADEERRGVGETGRSGPGAQAGESRARKGDAAREAGQAFRDCADCPEMVVAPDRSYAVGVYEVTRGEWAAFVRATGYSSGNSCWTYENRNWKKRSGRSWRNPGFSQTDRHPVVCVSWHDAQEYVGWLSEKTGQAYRLLTEAEWADVARGTERGSQCGYANGADLAAKRTYPHWTIVECDDGYVWTAPVGSYVPNGQGVYDVLGNVWEWVEDCWEGDCSRRVLRGGSWDNSPASLRSALRFGNGTGVRNSNGGFRLARTLTS